MQIRTGICRGLTFGTDHNKSGPQLIRIASHPVGTSIKLKSMKAKVKRIGLQKTILKTVNLFQAPTQSITRF
jgi:hypothetical protein